MSAGACSVSKNLDIYQCVKMLFINV